MSEAHRRFLIGFKQGTPDWNLLELPQVAALPAVLWKQHNLARLPDAQRAVLLAKLERALDSGGAAPAFDEPLAIFAPQSGRH